MDEVLRAGADLQVTHAGQRLERDPVIAVLDNLLPDNEPIRRRVAERVKADGYDAYSLLARVGRDCVGALQFLPEGQEMSSYSR